MSADDMEVLAAQPLVVMYRGERLELTPVTLGELPAFSRAAGPALPALALIAAATDENGAAVLQEVIEQYGDALFALVALGARREESWIRAERSIPAFIDLLNAVIEANRDFFIRKLRTERQSLVPARGAGPTPSSLSSSMATH